jgi:lipoprotein-releasing system permease protein
VLRLPFEVSLALRYLRPKRTFVSVITISSILGVMIGVAVLMIVIAVMSGFDREWRDRILSFNAHLKIIHRSGLMSDWRGPAERIKSHPMVTGVAPFILTQVMLQTQPKDTNELPRVFAPGLRGVDPELEKNVSNIPRTLISGEFDLSGHGMLVGAELAMELGLRVGDHVDVISAASLAEYRKMKDASSGDVVPDDYEVRGIFDAGFNDFNKMLIVTSLRSAQQLQNIRGNVHGIYVMLNDPFRAKEVREELERELGPSFEIKSWTQENAVIFGALASEKMMMYLILFVVMIVAAFAIVNSEITFAVNKMKEIGLMKSLGAANRQVMLIFLGHSVAVGIFGVGLGSALGLLVLHNLNNILAFMRKWAGYDPLPASIYQISELPYVLLPLDVTVICGGSFLICVLAGLIPAWKASRLQPVEALRNE